MEQRWRDTNAVHIKPAIVCQICVEVAHDSVQTTMVTGIAGELATRVTSPRGALCSHVYQGDLQNFLSSNIAHGIRVGTKGKVTGVNDARVLREVFDRIEPRTQLLTGRNSWVLEYDLPLVVFWKPARTLGVR